MTYGIYILANDVVYDQLVALLNSIEANISNTRTLIVLLVALAAAGVAAFGIARVIRSRPVVEREVAHTFVVAAAHTLAVGAMVAPTDVKLIAWPERTPVPGAFAKIEDVVNRGVVAQVLENEPITPTKLAPLGGGAGLPPTIPPGMRALSVRVNEVVGVAGFVVPGTRVDVCVTMSGGSDAATRVVVSNVQVLTAGTRYDQEKSKTGEPIPTSVVTLLLTPEDAGRVVLATTTGQLMLTLRNPLDQEPTPTAPIRMATLFGAPPAPERAPAPERPARPRPVVAVSAPPVAAPPPPPPKPYTVEAIRAAKRSEETVK
jgi:pilus assembly protein CpaB